MKPSFFILLCFIIPISLTAQHRTLESSHRRAPDWVNSLQRNFIIVVAEGENITDAQQKALTYIKEHIVTSVAANVRAESEIISEQAASAGDVTLFLEQFYSTVTTTTGDIPYLHGISVSKAEDYYWERLRHRPSGRVFYKYNIKYPFHEHELDQLVKEFQKRQQKMTDKLNAVIESYDDILSVEDIHAHITELYGYADYFSGSRQQAALNSIEKFNSLLNNMQIVEAGSRLGELRIKLTADERFFATSQTPHVQSGCAKITSVRQQGNKWVIRYNADFCYDDPNNHIRVSFRFGQYVTRNNFFFDIHEETVDISINEAIVFSSLRTDHERILKSEALITIYSRYNTGFEINKLIIEFDDRSPIIINNINKRFEGSGNHELVLIINQPLNKEKVSSTGRRMKRLSGVLHYTELPSDHQSTYRIYRHPYSTTW